MKIVWSGFKGENRALPPISMPDAVGTLSVNQNPSRGDFRPWRAALTVATVPSGRQTIYRMGRDVASDTNYWLSWTGVVYPVRGLIADDVTERTYYTGDGVPKWTDNTMALATAPYPTAFRLLGVPAPTSQLTLAASGGVSIDNRTTYYVYTYVTDKGEESAPSPVSLAITAKSDALISLSNITAPPSGNYGINRVRLYRTSTGAATDTDFFFLREQDSSLGTSADDGRTLGEVLPSAAWLTPPADLSCLTGLWNGMMAGISGNSVRFCVAYKPYAWPMAYDVVPADCKPVALAKFGQKLVILTTGRPVLVTGGSPEALDEAPIELAEACVSPRSVVGLGHGVVWACPDGLMYLGASGPKMLTAGIMTRDDWQAIKPETLIGSAYEGAYFGEYTVAGVTRGFVIDPNNPEGIFFTDIPATALRFDEYQDQLYILDGVNIKRWNAGAPVTANAKSRIHRLPKPVNFSRGKVVADSYPVTFKVYADGSQKMMRVVQNDKPFTLPAGFKAGRWQLEISSMTGVQGVAIAQSIEELKDI